MEQVKSKHNIIAEFYAEHYYELKAFVASRLPYEDEAEDIVQNVFVRLLQMDKMISPVTLPCLAYTTARNFVIDCWRRKECRERYEHYIIKGGEINKFAEDAESVYSAREIWEMLEQGIARLTENQASIYRLNVYGGFRVGEIAKKININYKLAERRLGNARKAVRSYMREMLAG